MSENPASDKQKSFAQTLGIDIPPGATTSEASALISAALAKEKADKAAGKPISEAQAQAGDAVAVSVATLERAIAGLSGLLAELKGERA